MGKRPKIRGLVQCLPLSPGVLFRLGESVLPIRGSTALEWHQAMRPSVEDPSVDATKLEAFANDNPAAFEKMCEALEAADMLYDAQGDSPELVPAALQKQFQSQIAQLEMKTSHPLTVFAAMRSKSVLILASSNVALAVAGAALESGLRRVTVCTLEDGNHAAKNSGVCADELSGAIVETASYQECRDALNGGSRFDYVIGAGIVGQNWKILEEHLTPLLASPGASAFFGLCAGPARVIAGNVEPPGGGGGCSGCLEAYCAEAPLERLGTSPLDISDAIDIGARLVIQHLWEMATASAEDNTRYSIFDFDLESCDLQRRPRPESLSACPRCRLPRRSKMLSCWADPRAAGTEAGFRELCQRAEYLYVDPRTGLIAQLDEGNLLQYPMHQCAALLNPNLCHGEVGWITEFGENMLVARVNAVRRALELSCERMFLCGVAPEALNCFSADLERAETLVSPLATGLVISALQTQHLSGEAFYRVLAQYANSLDHWREHDPEIVHSEAAANHLFPHLHETGALRHVQIQESVFREDVCVLRFLYDKEVISVVAGPEWEPVWASGLCDVWLKVTAPEAMPDRILEPGVRFRAAGPFPKPDILLRQIHAAERAFRSKFVLAPVVDTGRLAALPLYLFRAGFVQSNRIQHQEAEAFRTDVRTRSALAKAAGSNGRGPSAK